MPAPVSKLAGSVMVRLLRRRRIAVAVVLVVLSIPAFLAWEARRAVRGAREQTESAASIRATIHPFDRSLPADVEAVGAASVFRDAALFHGHLFVGGPQGLIEYDADGGVVKRFRTGLE